MNEKVTPRRTEPENFRAEIDASTSSQVIEEIKQAHDYDNEICVAADGRLVLVSQVEFELTRIVERQQSEIETLKAQVARLLEAVPSAAVAPRNK